MSGHAPLVVPESRRSGEEFPMMIVLSIIYPCNFGCPNCPYTDGNSEIRQFYRERGGDLFPVPLWEKIAREAGPFKATSPESHIDWMTPGPEMSARVAVAPGGISI